VSDTQFQLGASIDVGFDDSDPAGLTGACLSGFASSAGGFLKGLGEGAWDGITGMVQGIVQLGQDGYQLATSSQYRQQTWQSATRVGQAIGGYLQTAVTNPGNAANEAGNAAAGAWQSLKASYDQAAAQGKGSEFLGKLVGQSAVVVGTSFIPGGAEADAIGAAADVGRVTELATDAGKAAELSSDAGKVADVAGDGMDLQAANVAFRTEVRNGYTYTLDEMNRTTRIEGDLASNPAQGRNALAQLQAGGVDRLPTDEGGHFIGRRFDGPMDDFNHFAQDTNLNRGAYKSLENSWQRALNNGSSVNVDITPNYIENSLRPTSLDVTYSIDGVPYQKTFVNRPGGR
jgi:hypothetical protein